MAVKHAIKTILVINVHKVITFLVKYALKLHQPKTALIIVYAVHPEECAMPVSMAITSKMATVCQMYP